MFIKPARRVQLEGQAIINLFFYLRSPRVEGLGSLEGSHFVGEHRLPGLFDISIQFRTFLGSWIWLICLWQVEDEAVELSGGLEATELQLLLFAFQLLQELILLFIDLVQILLLLLPHI